MDIMTELTRNAKSTRTKAYKAYQELVADQWSNYKAMSTERLDLLARSHAMEVVKMSAGLINKEVPYRGGDIRARGSDYGDDIGGDNYGKGQGRPGREHRSEPFTSRRNLSQGPRPGAPASSGLTREAEVNPSAGGAGVATRPPLNLWLGAPGDDSTGVREVAPDKFERVDLVTREPTYDENAALDKRVRFYDLPTAELQLHQRQIYMDILLKQQSEESEDDLKGLLAAKKLTLEDYHRLERLSLRAQVANLRVIEAGGHYPHYMWKSADFSYVFGRRCVIKSHNRGTQRIMAAVAIPRNFRSGLINPRGEEVEGKSPFTVYLKGIPEGFFEGKLIARLLEFGPIASFFMERYDEEPYPCSGLAYVKFINPESVVAIMNTWWANIQGAGWPCPLESGSYKRIFADYSSVELLCPGYPDHHRDGSWSVGEEAHYCQPLNFRVPRHYGEFTKELLEAPYLYNREITRAGPEAVVRAQEARGERINMGPGIMSANALEAGVRREEVKREVEALAGRPINMDDDDN